MERSPGKRWLLILGLGLGLSLVALVGMMVYRQVTSPAGLPPAVGLTRSRISAREAFAPAAELASRWQPDARLAAVSGHWPAVGAQPGNQVEWAFQFFSLTADRLALVSVTDGEAQVVRQGVSPHPVPTFAAEEWRVDSGEALWTWWNGGGEELVAEHPQADLTMQLRVAEEGGSQPVWTVVGLVAGTEDATTVVVGASDGVVIEP